MGGSAALGFALFAREAGILACDVTVTARHAERLEKFAAKGLRTSTDNVEAVREADVVFFAVKPWQMEEVLLQCAPHMDASRQIAVSIAPGVKPQQLKEWLGGCKGGVPQIAYAIPNTAIEIGRSVTFLSPVTAGEDTMEALKRLFDAVGSTFIVPADKMLAGTSLASCGIAYAMRYIGASEEGGRVLGLSGEVDLRKAVCETVAGAAQLIQAKQTSVQEQIDRVTTPGGLTLRGLAAMEEGGFSDNVKKGLEAVNAKSRGRIVVKVGSNILTRADGSLDTTRVSSIVDQIVALRSEGYEVVLISSGAVACGRSIIREDRKLDAVQQRQLYSAVGQVRLMDLYYKLFSGYGVNVGQVLTTKNNFSSPQECSNQRSCMEVMLQSKVLPIVNENDTVSITELMFTDNDELSGLVAEMVQAHTLILLTNVDGIYTGVPGEEGSALIRTVRGEDSIDGFISEKHSSAGRGGMKSKCHIAREAASRGIRVMIANGSRDNVLTTLMGEGKDDFPHTEFLPCKN